MPRPKVRPETRKRVQHACRQCKASKRKCDAAVPCSYCVKRGCAEECEYAEATSTRNHTSPRSRTDLQSTSSIATPLEEEYSRNTGSICETQDDYSTHAIHNDEGTQSHVGSSGLDLGSPSTTRSRMLSRKQGEQVYIGKAASLSFLQLVREVVARCIGPSEFSVNPDQHLMLEIDLDLTTPIADHQLFNGSQARQCVDQYFLATIGLFYVLTDAEAIELVQNTRYNQPEEAALRLLILAIGAQMQPIEGIDNSLPEKHAFAQARKIAFANMLENPTLDIVRLFLLMSFYMLGACRRNAAFMYLGVAARAAHALGLHTTESYERLSADQRHARLRCWKSLVSLDLIVSSILGRVAVTLPPRDVDNKNFKITDEPAQQSNAELEATYRLALLVDRIASQTNGSEAITVKGATAHLKALTTWSTILPASLRPSTMPEACTADTRRSIIGSLHVSCFYYFAVMLVTRPFFILRATNCLAQRYGLSTRENTFKTSEEVEELASSCLHAASYMAQTCMDALQLNLLGENMVLLKAWIFAAGLVHGFHSFSSDETDNVVDDAFNACREVLSRLAIRSPQAAQYRDILSQFSLAIAKHRQLPQPPKRATPLVERIMSLRSGQVDGIADTPHSRDSLMSPLQSTIAGRNATGSSTPSYVPQGFDYTIGSVLPDLDNSSLLFGDWLTNDLQGFGTMPWDVL